MIQGLFPNSLLVPTAERVVNGFPRRKIVGQLPPLGTGLHDVENGIDDLLTRMLTRTSSPILRLKVRFDEFPFLLFQITWIAQQSALLCPRKGLTLPTFLFQDSFSYRKRYSVGMTIAKAAWSRSASKSRSPVTKTSALPALASAMNF